MHWWTREEDNFMRELLAGGFSFTQIATRCRERFNDHYTPSMISGRANRLGLCAKRSPKTFVDENGVEHRITTKQKASPKSFVPRRPTFNGLAFVDTTPAPTSVVDGCSCKWPTAYGGLCAEPAGDNGLCPKHSTVVRKCLSRARLEGV